MLDLPRFTAGYYCCCWERPFFHSTFLIIILKTGFGCFFWITCYSPNNTHNPKKREYTQLINNTLYFQTINNYRFNKKIHCRGFISETIVTAMCMVTFFSKVIKTKGDKRKLYALFGCQFIHHLNFIFFLCIYNCDSTIFFGLFTGGT